ncbi:hypothetical protein CLLI_14530 [Clostridium liquoris]|uniref:Uncharacterized protein n=1 Tax=Clostridium liquoris TaxID=1289519 RepID=A0A2T0B433_9CLOT|nr:AAA family ATPase [Clostridium liquoris]PRR78648.1 hypothetical protein CLLI_14530 [Clostridium liquoris]
MFIKRLYIGDFGIFHNETIRDLENGIVFIGGLNRAGKSTLHKVLSNLAYGFMKGDNLPPATSEYFAEGDIEKGDKLYNIKLDGYGEPIVNPKEDNNNLYSVDRYTYKELFTIDLDRLNNFSKEDKELQSVLLGAGLSEVIKLPNIIKELKKHGEKIGGKYGNPGTKLFKPYYLEAKEAVGEREQALKENKLFLEEKETIKNIEYNIRTQEHSCNKIKENLTILEILKDNYYNYLRYKEIEEELNKDNNKEVIKNFKGYSLDRLENLKEDYEKINSEYTRKSSVFNSIIERNKINGDKILINLTKIQYYFKESSGIREKYKNYLSLKEKNKSHRENIKLQINNGNSELSGDLDNVMKVQSDTFNVNYIADLIEKYKELKEEKKDISNRLDNLIREEKFMGRKNKEGYSGKSIVKYLYYLALAGSYAVGFSTLFMLKNKFAGGLLLLLISAAALMSFYLLRHSNEKEDIDYSIKDSIKEDENELEIVEGKIAAVEKSFSYCRQVLMLKENISPEGIKEYLKFIQDVKLQIGELLIGEEKENELKKELDKVIEDMNILIKQCFIEHEETESFNINHGLEEIEKLFSYGDFIKEIEALKIEKDELEQRIAKYLSLDSCEDIEDALYYCIENTKKIIELEKLTDEKDKALLHLKYAISSAVLKDEHNEEDFQKTMDWIFERERSKYSSLEQIENCYEENIEKMEKLNKYIEELKEKRQHCIYNMKTLEESSNVEKAQKKIYRAKGELKSLAEKYAVLNASTFILEKVYDSFLNKAKDSILKDSSDIFNKITLGEYEKILPGEDLSNFNFKTLLKQGNIQQDSDILSRGTREQLFLSVRLSRIMEIEPMPIIIDDSLVNFDSKSLESTAKIIKELSKRNQIFILTCHSKLIEFMEEEHGEIQYIKLNKGEFSYVDRNELISYLG